MEVTAIANSSASICRSDRGLGFCYDPKIMMFSRKNRICFGRNLRFKNAGIRVCLNSIGSDLARSEKISGAAPTSASRRSKTIDDVRLFVGLPLDAVSDCNALKHARAIAAGLKALKLLGVEGVELPVWWGVVEKKAMGNYEWSSYLEIAEMVQNVGLKLHVSLCFHACKAPKVPLPAWVSQIGEQDPSIYFTDRSGKQYKECLSLAVDELSVLNGKSPLQVYQDFCESFKSSFSAYMGSTITGISMGLGPDGELRYPSHHQSPKANNITGVGEFQCYDKNMLTLLKKHAEETGNPLYGLSGPHDTPSYDQSPNTNNFFNEHGGSWETPYGNFFLSWYSNELITHGNRLLALASTTFRLLALASTTFRDLPVTISGKVPLMHSWYKTRSRPSELTAGFKNGYEPIVDLFSKNSCKMILPGMDLSDEHQPQGSHSSPELLLEEIKGLCKNHGVGVSGQNLEFSGAPGRFEQIKKNLLDDNEVVDLFTYQRMGVYFFSPEHFPKFSEFVRSLNQPELDLDDRREVPAKSPSLSSEKKGKDVSLQVA
uniref:Beta-amylase n=1 Tax=Gunnera manicata TaxID=24957 RepID=E5KC10_9MAGN|nr:beta-amylase [Gunnera manicata]